MCVSSRRRIAHDLFGIGMRSQARRTQGERSLPTHATISYVVEDRVFRHADSCWPRADNPLRNYGAREQKPQARRQWQG